MRAFVTGAAGFIGAALVRSLSSDGWQVDALARPQTDVFRLRASSPAVQLVRCDLNDVMTLRDWLESRPPDVVFHAAASRGHPRSPDERLSAWRDVVLGTASLLEAMRSIHPIPLVHLGSSLEYEPSDCPLDETQPLRPRTPRGAMKLASAVAVRQWADEEQRPAVIIRPFSVYGELEPAGRVVPTIVSCLRSGAPFQTTTAAYRRDFVHVDDVVDACRRAATDQGATGRDFNIGTGVGTSTQDLVELAQVVTGRKLRVRHGGFPPRPSDVEHWVADSGMARASLGWAPKVSLAAGLERLCLAGSEL